MTTMRRVLGVILIIVGIVGLLISGGVAYFGAQLVDSIGVGLNSSLGLVLGTVNTTTDTLRAVQGTIGEAATTINTVSETTANLSKTLVDSTPLLQQVTTLTTETVPVSLDAVTAAVPNLAEIAGTIDTTLTTLSNLKVERAILGVPISFDLGVSYRPEEPFDQAVLQIGDSLVGVPEQLRQLQGGLQTAVGNLGAISTNVKDLSGNLTGIYDSVGQFNPLIDQYITTLDQTASGLLNVQNQLNSLLGTLKWVFLGLGIWFALYQILPLYFGWRMVRDREPEEVAEEAVANYMNKMKDGASEVVQTAGSTLQAGD